MPNLNHSQFQVVEWAKAQPDQTGDHVVFCLTCNLNEKVHGLAKLVEFYIRHAGHTTVCRTFTDKN